MHTLSVRSAPLAMLFVAALVAGGCANPASTAVKLGARVVGKVVDDAESDKLGQELIGRAPAAADAKLGKRIDTLRDENRPREWLVYPVGMDVLGKLRFVVEVESNKIAAVAKVEKGGSTYDIPRKLLISEKVKGLKPRECEQKLEMGPPLVTVRSVNTKDLGQIYDGRMIKELGGEYYCVLRFDRDERCTAVEFVEVAASTKKGITK